MNLTRITKYIQMHDNFHDLRKVVTFKDSTRLYKTYGHGFLKAKKKFLRSSILSCIHMTNRQVFHAN